MPIALCSWSVRPTSPHDLAAHTHSAGLKAVQLALDPIRIGQWSSDDTRDVLRSEGITIVSGMMAMHGEDYSTLDSIKRTGGVRSNAHWQTNLDAARANSDVAEALGIRLVTFHAGFLPHDPSDPLRITMLDRLAHLADIFGDRGIAVAFETGQEKAPTLAAILHDLARPQDIGVNFDPANMILYDMGDPIQAVRMLAPCIRQFHIKDAKRTTEPGQWGTEVPVGSGDVRWPAFFAAVRECKLEHCDLVIEREVGQNRVADIAAAATLIRSHL